MTPPSEHGADSSLDPSTVGGIVLAGGKSTRMGRSKAHLPFGGELMLQRVVRLLSHSVGPIVVVGAGGQDLPPLPAKVLIARDEVADQGPLQGLATGLKALAGKAHAAYACSCDAPLIKAAFVNRMIELLDSHQIAVPYVDEFHHPLAAVYRLAVLEQIHALLASDRRRPVFLFESVDARIVVREQLTGVDPQLESLKNCNHRDDYHQALASAGFEPSNQPRPT